VRRDATYFKFSYNSPLSKIKGNQPNFI
jgi:hypothetical protein